MSPTFGIPWPPLNDGIIYNGTVKYAPGASDLTVLDYLGSAYKHSATKEGWLQRINNKQVLIDGEIVSSPNLILRNGSKLVYHRISWVEPYAPFVLNVLYEDEHLLAVNKPSGLQVLPGGLFQQRTVLTQLKWRRESNAVKTSSHPTPVHRLGRGTSGVLLCAKSKKAKSMLAAELAAGSNTSNKHQGKVVISKTIRKMYRALVHGVLLNDEIYVDQPIGRVEYPGVAGGLYMASSTGKPSQSKVTKLWSCEEANQTLVEVEIFSGRPHQIRIHMAFIGHPLVGDPLYVNGGKPLLRIDDNVCDVLDVAMDGGHLKPNNPLPGDTGYLLHAHRLVLRHPITEVEMELVAPAPNELCTPEEKQAS